MQPREYRDTLSVPGAHRNDGHVEMVGHHPSCHGLVPIVHVVTHSLPHRLDQELASGKFLDLPGVLLDLRRRGTAGFVIGCDGQCPDLFRRPRGGSRRGGRCAAPRCNQERQNAAGRCQRSGIFHSFAPSGRLSCVARGARTRTVLPGVRPGNSPGKRKRTTAGRTRRRPLPYGATCRRPSRSSAGSSSVPSR